MHTIPGYFDFFCNERVRIRRRRGRQKSIRNESNENVKGSQSATVCHNYPANYWYQVRTLLIIVLSLNCLNDLYDNHKSASNNDRQTVDKSLIQSTVRWTRGILQVVALVAAADSYADASAESPSIDALEDEDDDDEELDASASNEYPDGDNDNDESYEDADDDRQESRITENWLPFQVLTTSLQQQSENG